jgi:hypothetical protein
MPPVMSSEPNWIARASLLPTCPGADPETPLIAYFTGTPPRAALAICFQNVSSGA